VKSRPLVIPHFDAKQLENIIERVVPLVAKPEDHEFFRGLLYCHGENSSSAAFAAFIAKPLRTHDQLNTATSEPRIG